MRRSRSGFYIVFYSPGAQIKRSLLSWSLCHSHPTWCNFACRGHVCGSCLVLTRIPLTYEQSQLIHSHHASPAVPHPAVPHPVPLPSGGPAFVTRVVVTLSHSLSSTERGRDRAGQTPGRARLLLPGLSARRPLLPSLLRAPGWLPPLAVLLPGRASHLSHCHAVQLVDRTDAGPGLSGPAWDFNRHYWRK